MSKIRCLLAVVLAALAPVAANAQVALLDAWQSDPTYCTQNATFTVSGSAGDDRIALVALSAEENGNGPISVNQVLLGDQVLTPIFNFVVGPASSNTGSGYHNLLWLGYLLDDGIRDAVGTTLTITWTNAPTGNATCGAFGEVKIHYGSYSSVDQTTPIGASPPSNTEVGTAGNSNQATIQPGTITAGANDQVLVVAVEGQAYTWSAPEGYGSPETEECGLVGDCSDTVNDHTSAVFARTQGVVSENPLFTSNRSSATGARQSIGAIALQVSAVVSARRRAIMVD